jgi:dUTP pyrophosphatase
LKVKFKKTHELSKTPEKAHDSDAGFDLTAVSKITDEFGNIVYDTGISLELPKGYYGLVLPRSSISKKTLNLANSVGLIDPDYRGSVILKFKPTPYMSSRTVEENYDYEVGDKIGQLLILPFPTIELLEVEALSSTIRNDGGFGSTDKKTSK